MKKLTNKEKLIQNQISKYDWKFVEPYLDYNFLSDTFEPPPTTRVGDSHEQETNVSLFSELTGQSLPSVNNLNPSSRML